MPINFTALWRVSLSTPPSPLRHCSRCGADRPFRCSGKVRLNANGRRVDAWLIYRCHLCDTTWNLPILQRTALRDVPPTELQAMHESDPAWVEARAFDLALIRRHGARIEETADLVVTKQVTGPVPQDWQEIALHIEAPHVPWARLDRVLSLGLRLSRAEVSELLAVLQRKGAARIGQVTRLHLASARMTAAQGAAVLRGIGG